MAEDYAALPEPASEICYAHINRVAHGGRGRLGERSRITYTGQAKSSVVTSMLIKTLIVITLVAILVSLGSGMFFLLKDKGQTERTAKALTVRIVLSVSLFGLLMLGIFTGHIKPHGIYPKAPATVDNTP
jgi:hypothetical protein